jgi:hypothetical protein
MLNRCALTILGTACLLVASAQAQEQRTKGAALTALDHADIQRLYAEYAHTFDSCADNGQAFARLFAPDGVFILPDGRALEGREKLVEFARCPAGVTRRPTQHWIGSVLIKPAPEGASATAYVMQVNVAEPKLSSSGGRYETIFVKGPDGWAFKKHAAIRPPRGPAPATPQ